MTNRISSAIRSVGHTSTGFGSYMVNLQSCRLQRRPNASCEGGPTADEARRDYQRTLEAANGRF